MRREELFTSATTGKSDRFDTSSNPFWALSAGHSSIHLPNPAVMALLAYPSYFHPLRHSQPINCPDPSPSPSGKI